MKRTLSIVLALIMVLTISSAAFAASNTDVPESHWAYASIESCKAKGLMQGVADSSFDPDGTLTRAQVAQICYNAYGATLTGKTDYTLSDVAAGAWYYDAMYWMAGNGIINGTKQEDGRILCYPDATADRKYVALILNRIATKLDVALPTTNEAITFSDIADLAGEYQRAITNLQRAGVIDGYADGTFHPNGSLTRAEAAKLFDAYTDLSGLEPVKLAEPPVTTPPVTEPNVSGDFYDREYVVSVIGPYGENLGFSLDHYNAPNGGYMIVFLPTDTNHVHKFVAFSNFPSTDGWRYRCYAAPDATQYESGYVYNMNDMKAVLDRQAARFS